ncbi:MAG TPA: hypothetical protein VHR66_01400 [Gemmataceae bacterium]|jgi:hypothetical protein|nr:hypothetical protein [Gemmataceae bacterium]
MTRFDPNNYPPAIAALWSIERLPELGPGTPNLAAQEALNSLSVESVFPDLRDREAGLACISGLWLYHDFLDVSHTISQDLECWIGSYWHAIMHRREPDPSNSKYWWRRVGYSPIFTDLLKDALELGYWGSKTRWNPEEFVDSCEAERGSGNDREMILRRVQLREMHLVFDWCYRHAVGG